MEKLSYHIVSRHPHSIPASIRPFDALSSDIWLTFVCIFTCIAFFMLFARSSIKSHQFYQGHMNIIVLSAFTIMVFNTFFGMDLRDALITQDFEPQVNTWNDVTFLQSHIKYVTDEEAHGRGFEFVNTNLPRQKVAMYFNLLENWQEHFGLDVIFELRFFNSWKNYLELAENAQTPNEHTFLMSE